MTKKKKSSQHRPKSSSHHHRDSNAFNEDDNTTQLKRQLSSLGLVIKDMTGDGNCLFRALSDQFHGSPDSHSSIRALVCKHIREHEDLYKPFLDEGNDVTSYVKQMSKNGIYGGNLEIVAFARENKVDIAIHQAGLPPWIINGDEEEEQESSEKMENEMKSKSSHEKRPLLHIAYHSWEHYSSIRNEDGPFSGPPNIVIKSKNKDDVSNDKTRDESDHKAAWDRDTTEPPTKMEKMIMNTTSTTRSLSHIRDLLRKYRGDSNKVMDELFEEMDQKNTRNEEAVIPPDDDGASHKREEQQQLNVEQDDGDASRISSNIKEGDEILETSAKKTPKKVSARMKKEQAKKKQKQQALEKKREKKRGHSTTTSTSTNTAPPSIQVKSGANGVEDLVRQTEAIRI